jgi:hypothetical protein
MNDPRILNEDDDSGPDVEIGCNQSIEIKTGYLGKIMDACERNPVLNATDAILGWMNCPNPCPEEFHAGCPLCQGDGGHDIARWN